MLVLKRSEGQTLVIDDRITISFVSCSGSRVVVGIDAPADVSIWRGELIASTQPSENVRGQDAD